MTASPYVGPATPGAQATEIKLYHMDVAITYRRLLEGPVGRLTAYAARRDPAEVRVGDIPAADLACFLGASPDDGGPTADAFSSVMALLAGAATRAQASSAAYSIVDVISLAIAVRHDLGLAADGWQAMLEGQAPSWGRTGALLAGDPRLGATAAALGGWVARQIEANPPRSAPALAGIGDRQAESYSARRFGFTLSRHWN